MVASGDSESIWIFDPANPAQASLAIKLVHPKRKRVLNLTDEQKQILGDRLQSARARQPVNEAEFQLQSNRLNNLELLSCGTS
jgi:hypothetical protein